MCIVADRSHLSNTRIFAGKYDPLTTPAFMQGFTDLLIYSNDAVSFVSENCMLLPIPAEVNDVQVIDGTSFVPLIKELENVFPVELTRGISKKSISIRQEKVGIYTVSYVSVNDLEKACKQYNFKIQSEMIEFLKTYYKDWTIVLCTWSGTDSISAQPVVITFNSAFSLEVYIPMTDGHGTVPKHGDVDRNHKVGIGVQGWSGNYELDTVKALGFSTFSGNILEGNHPNGDIYIDLNKSKTISNQLWNKFVF